MKILVAEYAVGEDVPEFMLEGKAMLDTLVRSFVSCGHEVFYPTAGIELDSGEAVLTDDLEDALVSISKKCDAGLIIAPDELLADLTRVVEENTVNLGCPPGSVELCADKLECARVLEKNNIPVPKTTGHGDYRGAHVIKPRYGCASENTYKSTSGTLKDGFIATRFIEGEHLSVSLISGKTQLPLTVNKQLIEINDSLSYKGGIINYQCERSDDVIEVAKKTARVLGCQGYTGVDIVLGDVPYVIDVNPRPTTSIIGIAKILDTGIADLILRSKFSQLPPETGTKGSFTVKKDELSTS